MTDEKTTPAPKVRKPKDGMKFAVANRPCVISHPVLNERVSDANIVEVHDDQFWNFKATESRGEIGPPISLYTNYGDALEAQAKIQKILDDERVRRMGGEPNVVSRGATIKGITL